MSKDNLTDREDVRELVRQKYGEAALRVLQGQGGACCGGAAQTTSTCCGDSDPVADEAVAPTSSIQ